METKHYDLEGTREKMLAECRVGSTTLSDMLSDAARYAEGQKLVCTVQHILDECLMADIRIVNDNGLCSVRYIRRTDVFTLASRGYSYFEATAVEAAKMFMSTIIQHGIYSAQDAQKNFVAGRQLQS